MVNGKDIVDVAAGEPGSKSDLSLFRETHKEFESNQRFNGDKADQGEKSIKTPAKKSKKQELTPEKSQETKD